jgi:Family of unknown function (DUF6069)
MASATAAPISSTDKPAFGALLKAGATGGAIAAAINGALYFGTKAAGVPFTGVFQPGQGVTELPAPLPFVSSFMPSLVAAGLLFGLTRLTSKAGAAFLAIAAIFAVVSCYGPLNIAEASLGTRGVLTLMHFTAAVPITYFLLRALKR